MFLQLSVSLQKNLGKQQLARKRLSAAQKAGKVTSGPNVTDQVVKEDLHFLKGRLAFTVGDLPQKVLDNGNQHAQGGRSGLHHKKRNAQKWDHKNQRKKKKKKKKRHH